MFVFLLIGTNSLEALRTGNLENEAISDEIGIILDVGKYGIIGIPDNNILDLIVDFSEQKEEIREEMIIRIAVNIEIGLTIEQIPEEFGNKLDELLNYEYKYNSTTMSFGIGSIGYASVSSFFRF